MNQKGLPTASFFLLCLLLLLGSSCSPRLLFTEQTREHLDAQNIDIERVQFYTDKELVLRRKLESNETKVSKGEITQIDGERTQEIRIPRGTPGIVDQVAEGKIWLIFEDCKGCAMRFYKNPFDTYQVDADDWFERKGQIDYDGKTFYLIHPNNDALLMVKKRQIYKDNKNSRVAKGLRVDGKNNKKRKKLKRKDIKELEEDERYEDENNDSPNWDDDVDWDGGSSDDDDSDSDGSEQ